MAKKKFDINKRSKPMTEVVKEFEGEASTVDAVNIFENNPTIENKEKAVEAVTNDKALSAASPELLDQIQALFIQAFSSNSIPSEYSNLKREAKYLADLNQVSGLYMAQRLVIIRDKELFKEDGYADFKSFIESELNISRSTVYNYMDIIDQFVSKRLNTTIDKLSLNRSKLVPFLPLLKSDKITKKAKDKIRDNVISELDTKSFRDLSKEAKDLKVEYGLVKPKETKPIKTESSPLIHSLESMYESIKLLSHSKANDAFLLVLEHLEMDNLISGKELGQISSNFTKYK